MGSCEHSNEPSVSIKGGEFLDKLSDCYLLKKGSASWNLFVLRVTFLIHCPFWMLPSVQSSGGSSYEFSVLSEMLNQTH